jgi:predicted enzyme related to lactoylglutathione lyase
MARSRSFASGTVMSARRRRSARCAERQPVAPALVAQRRVSVRATSQSAFIEYLKDHPQSTAGDMAKGLNANRNTIATRLSRMVKEGEITKASKGYTGR